MQRFGTLTGPSGATAVAVAAFLAATFGCGQPVVSHDPLDVVAAAKRDSAPMPPWVEDPVRLPPTIRFGSSEPRGIQTLVAHFESAWFASTGMTPVVVLELDASTRPPAYVPKLEYESPAEFVADMQRQSGDYTWEVHPEGVFVYRSVGAYLERELTPLDVDGLRPCDVVQLISRQLTPLDLEPVGCFFSRSNFSVDGGAFRDQQLSYQRTLGGDTKTVLRALIRQMRHPCGFTIADISRDGSRAPVFSIRL